jgi:predicted HNH restriction endonuclease
MPYKNHDDHQRRLNRIKIKAIAYLGGKCVSCNIGDLHPASYDFHHRDPAQKDVSWNKLQKRSWDKIVSELKKCDLICSNCHRVVHIRKTLW